MQKCAILVHRRNRTTTNPLVLLPRSLTQTHLRALSAFGLLFYWLIALRLMGLLCHIYLTLS